MSKSKSSLAVCLLSATLVSTFFTVFTFTSFRLVTKSVFWNRFDQLNLISAPFWGLVCSFLLSSYLARSYGSKYLIMFSHAWQCYFALFTVRLEISFYQIWLSQFFTAMAGAAIIMGVFQRLRATLPDHDLLVSSFLMVSSVGIGNIIGTFISWLCIAYYGRWFYSYVLLSFFSLLLSITWKSKPNVESKPSNRSKKSDSIESMLWNVESVQFAILGFGIGYFLSSLLTFHGIHYLEIISLQSNLGELNVVTLLPWFCWFLGALLFSYITHIKNKIPFLRIVSAQWLYGTRDIFILVTAVMILCCISLYGTPSHMTMGQANMRFCPLYFLSAILLSFYFILHFNSIHSEPEYLLGWSLTWFSFGGVISTILGGMVLEMAGSWKVIFRYQVNVLFVAAVLGSFLPWLFCFRLRRVKRPALLPTDE